MISFYVVYLGDFPKGAAKGLLVGTGGRLIEFATLSAALKQAKFFSYPAVIEVRVDIDNDVCYMDAYSSIGANYWGEYYDGLLSR